MPDEVPLSPRSLAEARRFLPPVAGNIVLLVSKIWRAPLGIPSEIEKMSTTTPGAFHEPEQNDQAGLAAQSWESAAPVTVEQLADIQFFRGIAPDHLKLIARYSKRCHFNSGQTIFREGELANCFYVVRSGRVVIECKAGGRRVPVQEIGPGEPIGFSWFFNPDNFHFSARAIEPVEAVFFYGTLLREECELDHELGYEVMQRTSQVMLSRLESLTTLLARMAALKPAPPPR